MGAKREIQVLVCGNPCWSGSVALEEVLSEARQRQRRDSHAMCTTTLKVTQQDKFSSRTLACTLSNNEHTTLIVITGESCAVKMGSSLWKIFQICFVVEVNLLGALSCCSCYEFCCILK